MLPPKYARDPKKEEKEISKEIKEIEKRIDETHLKRGVWTLSKRLNALRIRVLSAHPIIEAGLEMIITDKLLELASPIDIRNTKIDKKLRSKWFDFIVAAGSVFEKMNFYQKLNTSYVSGKMNKHLAYHIKETNRIRNLLVHPLGRNRQYKNLEKEEEYLTALRHVLASLNGIAMIEMPYLDQLHGL